MPKHGSLIKKKDVNYTSHFRHALIIIINVCVIIKLIVVSNSLVVCEPLDPDDEFSAS